MVRRLVLLGLTMTAVSAQALIVGQWEFDGNLNATVGSSASSSGNVAFENADIGGATAQVARFGDDAGDGGATSTAGHNSYFTIQNPIGGNGGGSFTNRYTLIMDVYFAETPGFISMYQTNQIPAISDGDWFIRGSDNGMGISGDYTDTGNALRFADARWQRIALAVDTASPTGPDSQYRVYVDGALQNVVQSPSGWGLDGRYALGSLLHIFADEDFETQEGLINSLQLRDYAMSAAEIAGLGGASATGIVPEPATVAALALGLAAMIRRRR